MSTDEDIDLQEAERVHGNNGRVDYFCCPHCVQSNYYSFIYDGKHRVTCVEEDCKKQFVAWLEHEPVCISGFMPGEESLA